MNTHSDVSDRPPHSPNNSSESQAKKFVREEFLARLARWVLRWALAVTTLSAVADRFGLWGPPGSANVSWGDWPHFVAYTAKVNSFWPGAVVPALAIVATVAEVLLGVALILGVFRRPVAWASAILLALFVGAMTLSFGIKAPLNYSVFADAAAAFALGAWPAAPNHREHREAICHSHNRSL
jgi:putative oxidoreductase